MSHNSNVTETIFETLATPNDTNKEDNETIITFGTKTRKVDNKYICRNVCMSVTKTQPFEVLQLVSLFN